MKEWFIEFWKKHGERHLFAIEVTVFVALLWFWMPQLREQLTGAMMVVLSLFVKEIRSTR